VETEGTENITKIGTIHYIKYRVLYNQFYIISNGKKTILHAPNWVKINELYECHKTKDKTLIQYKKEIAGFKKVNVVTCVRYVIE